MLIAPEEYWQLTTEEKNKLCNGCGPKAIEQLIPDSIWGLSIINACFIHDYEYSGKVPGMTKLEADFTFLSNMIDIINMSECSWYIRSLRLSTAWIYFKLVRMFGKGPPKLNKNI
jgi:hypothetical protein